VAEVAWLAARFHPDISLERLQLVSDWYAWFFYQDDLYHETDIGRDPGRLDTLHMRLLALLRGARLSARDEPLAHALVDLRQRWYQLAPRAWMNHFTYQVAEFFAAMAWEATNRLRANPPPLATYLRIRPITGGLAIEQLIAELVEELTFPSEVHAYATLHQLRLLADHAVCWTNDLVSLHKELRQRDVHNLVLVLQHEHALSLPEAIRRAVRLHDQVVTAFDQLPRQPPCPTWADTTSLQRHIEVLRTRIRGNLDWTYEVGRYRQAAD